MIIELAIKLGVVSIDYHNAKMPFFQLLKGAYIGITVFTSVYVSLWILVNSKNLWSNLGEQI